MLNKGITSYLDISKTKLSDWARRLMSEGLSIDSREVHFPQLKTYIFLWEWDLTVKMLSQCGTRGEPKDHSVQVTKWNIQVKETSPYTVQKSKKVVSIVPQKGLMSKRFP